MKLAKLAALVAILATPALAADKNRQSSIALPWEQQPAQPEYKVNNFDVGALLGYDFEGERDWSWGGYVGYLLRPNQTLGVGVEADAMRPFDGDEWLVSLRLRAGIYVSPQTFIYGTGGAAWDSTNWETGWVAGGGVEYSLAKNVSVRAEWLHYELDTCEDPVRDVGRVGLSFKF